MEALDAARRQSVGLPPINHLDTDRLKREEGDYQRNHSTPAKPSPLHPFPAPSHPHSTHHPPSAAAPPGSLAGLLSPPESRRTSGDEKEMLRPTARQSLPSIHEALGSDQSLPYPAPAPPPVASTSTTHQYPPPAATASPSEPRMRSTNDPAGTQGPSNPYSQTRSPYIGPSANQTQAHPPPPPPPHSHADPYARTSYPEQRPPYSTPQHNPKLPSLHPLKTAPSPPPSAARPYAQYPPAPPPTYENPAPRPAEPVNHHYAYAQYPPAYPPSGAPLGPPAPGYPPPTSTYPGPRYPGAWHEPEPPRMEEKKLNRASLAPYGESVKRHLESFDLEASLNEMADGSGRISEFSKIYRQRAHENQRIGLTPQSLPRLEDVDEMIKQGDRIQMSLQRMRDVVYNHHQASVAEPPQNSHYQRLNGYEHDAASNYGDDSKLGGGFAGADNKTRKRGRAAPPGRCHSCNRAETPEWRRGPDGARTLCNACGLHYAKLTRKMGGKQAMTSSNLRPKSLDQGSPAL